MKNAKNDEVENVRRLLREAFQGFHVPGTIEVVRCGTCVVFEFHIKKKHASQLIKLSFKAWQACRNLVDQLGKANGESYVLTLVDPPLVTWAKSAVVEIALKAPKRIAPTKALVIAA